MNKRRQRMESKKVDTSDNDTAEDVQEALPTAGATALAPAVRECGEEEITREQRRSRRKRAVRARTISVKRMTKRELEIGRLLYPEVEVEKPRTREECAN